jgi:hypothetical protein
MACTSAALIKSFGSTISLTVLSLGTSTDGCWRAPAKIALQPRPAGCGLARDPPLDGTPMVRGRSFDAGPRTRSRIAHTGQVMCSVFFDVDETGVDETLEYGM